MVTLDELYTQPRFREMSEVDLLHFILENPTKTEDTISVRDYYNLPPVGYRDVNKKASNLIAYFKKHPLKEEQPIRLKEGMGVVNATLEQQKAIVALASVIGVGVSEILSNLKLPHYTIYWQSSEREIWYQGTDGKPLSHPVTFREFCQAILNEEKPKRQPVDMGERSICNQCNQRMCHCEERQVDRSWKPKEETVKLDGENVYISIRKDDCLLFAKISSVISFECIFPLSIIDDLVAAKERITK